MAEFDALAPVIIAVGEASRKTVPGEWPSPRELAGAAIKAALADTGQAKAVSAAIDTIAAIRAHNEMTGDNAPARVITEDGRDKCKSARERALSFASPLNRLAKIG